MTDLLTRLTQGGDPEADFGQLTGPNLWQGFQAFRANQPAWNAGIPEALAANAAYGGTAPGAVVSPLLKQNPIIGAFGTDASAPGFAGIFAGDSALKADWIARDSMIQHMKAFPDNPELAWQKTGWGYDLSGKPMWEISDENARVLPGAFKPSTVFPSDSLFYNGPLAGVFDHPELYANYPQLSQADVTISQRPMPADADGTPNTGTAWHAFDPLSGRSVISVHAPNNHPSLSPDELTRRLLVHEANHGVQNIEEFAPGGTSQLFEPKQHFVQTRANRMYLLDDAVKLRQFLDQGMNHAQALDAYRQAFNQEPIPNALTAAVSSTPSQLSLDHAHAKLLYDLAQAHYPNTPQIGYLSLGGEVMSRLAERRLDYDPSARRFVDPWYHAEEMGFPRQLWINLRKPPWNP